MRSLRESLHGVVDLGMVLMIGISFTALMVVAYIIWHLKNSLWTTPTTASTAYYNTSYSQAVNITQGFDNAVALILVAITIFILAVAISALLMLRSR